MPEPPCSRIAPEDAKTAGVCAARAHVLLALGDNDRARQDLEAAIRLEPENVLARITRGRLALAEKRPEAAADDLVRALARWPDSRDEFDLRAVVNRLIATNDAVFARAVSLRPDDPQVWVARGRHLAWLGRWRDASDAYTKGSARDRRPTTGSSRRGARAGRRRSRLSPAVRPDGRAHEEAGLGSRLVRAFGRVEDRADLGRFGRRTRADRPLGRRPRGSTRTNDGSTTSPGLPDCEAEIRMSRRSGS